MTPNAQMYDSMLAHLTAVATDLVKTFGYNSIQISACVQMDKGDESTALHVGVGSYHERVSVAREFVLRSEELIKQDMRSRQ